MHPAVAFNLIELPTGSIFYLRRKRFMLYTRYVWTADGMIKGRSDETREKDFPARYGYEPMEKNPEATKAWLEAGFIKKVDEKLPFLQFYWKGKFTSPSKHMIQMFNENYIRWEKDPYGTLFAEIGPNNEMVPVEYYHVAGNLYGITEKPRSTSEYFKLTPEELYKENSDGYSKEDALLCDNNVHAKPFAKDLYHAIRKAADYIAIGCDGVEILQTISNRYAVVCK